MNNGFKIWVSLCLIGLVGSIISSVNQPISLSNAIEYGSSDDSNGIDNSVLFPTHSPYLFLAESVNEISSETEPRNSVAAGWTLLQEKYDSGLLYIQRSHSFSLSQDVRNMIFPFHSYL